MTDFLSLYFTAFDISKTNPLKSLELFYSLAEMKFLETDSNWAIQVSVFHNIGCLLYNQGSADSKVEGKKWLIKAAKLNHATAILELGLMYEEEQDRRVLACLQKSSKLGNSKAILEIKSRYLTWLNEIEDIMLIDYDDLRVQPYEQNGENIQDYMDKLRDQYMNIQKQKNKNENL